jgi:hypothetical protein
LHFFDYDNDHFDRDGKYDGCGIKQSSGGGGHNNATQVNFNLIIDKDTDVQKLRIVIEDLVKTVGAINIYKY